MTGSGPVRPEYAAAEPRRLAEAVHAALGARSETVATAESLTGGLVAVLLTDVPGASLTYRGGIVAYATPLKADLLGVPAPLLAERGAVDPDVAAAMATGARDRLGADHGVATTGVAGPDPQDGQAVGTVFVAVAGPGGTRVERHRFEGDRPAIRAAAAVAALALLVESVTSVIALGEHVD